MSKSLTQGSVSKTLFRLSLPIILAQILQSAYQFIDAFWVGKLGGDAIAAVSVSFPMVFLTVALGAGFAIAGSTLTAQYAGAKNHTMVNHVAAQTLLTVFCVSITLGVIGFVFTPHILSLMDVDAHVYENARIFMRISLIGVVASFSFMMFQSLMRGIGQVSLPLYIVGGAVLLNFILDPLFIFGFHWGIGGAAIATIISQGLAAAVGLGILLSGKYGIHVRWSDFRPDFTFIKRSFLLGFPASIEMSARALGLTVMTFLIAQFGTLTIASYGVGSTLLQFVMIFCMGLSMAISTLVGQNIGAGHIDRAEKTVKIGAFFSFILMTGIGILGYIFAPYFIHIFVADAAVIEAGTVLIRIMSWSFGFLGIQFAIIGALRASGNMMSTMFIALISQWIIQIPAAYLLSRTSLHVVGLWWALPLTNVLTAIIAVSWFMTGKWKRTKLTKEEKLQEHVTEEIILEEGVR